MRLWLCLLLAVACARADESEDRRSKLPYVADAVGNKLPPPSNGPATVGSPVNLLTPDRYEFYTFDESGELVKRLMTLEEIQAIVAAGEETEGLVTFANENQPTIAFNFSQPPYTKVHSVVTNVQNVLKAQMEAHKNKPLTQPTLDTPDVSDSWSLILPSIFGNTGVDIVPDKTSGTFTTPETETIDLDRVNDNSLSKEGTNQILTSSSTKVDNIENKEVGVTQQMPALSSTTKRPETSSTTSTTTTTTPKPTSPKPLPTKPLFTKPLSTSTSAQPTTSTTRPTVTSHKPTTAKIHTTASTTNATPTSTTTTNRPRTTTSSKPRTTTTSKPTTKIVRTTPKPTTTKPNTTTKKSTTPHKEPETTFTKIQIFTNDVSSPDKTNIQYEKVSTFVPLSTAAYVTERSTQKPVQTTKTPFVSTTKRYLSSTAKRSSTTIKTSPTTTTYKSTTISSTVHAITTPKDEVEKFNATTVTTQSISPPTTVMSTKVVPIGYSSTTEKNGVSNKGDIENLQPVPLFDVAQSFSQIASDLGGNFQPLPTTSDLLDTTNVTEIDLESKENIEIEIPADSEKSNETKKTNKDEKETGSNIPQKTQTSDESYTTKNTEKPLEKGNITEMNDKDKVDKHNIEKIYNTKKPNENESEIVGTKNNNTDNFVKISTMEPHSKNKNKISTKKPEVKETSTTTTIGLSTKMESTTAHSETVGTSIDPVLSESMDDLFSQIVNQAPATIFESEKQSSDENVNFTTKVPKISEEVTYSEKFETTTSQIPKQDSKPTKLQEIKYKPHNIANNATGINKNTKESEKFAHNPTNNDNIDTTNKIKDMLIQEEHVQLTKILEGSTTKQNNYVQTTTDKSELNPNKDPPKNAISSTIKKETLTKNTTNPVEKISTNITTTTEISPKKSTTTKKTESPSSNVNKIIASENNKVVNHKESDKKSEDQVPKIEEFKKKIQKVNIDEKELANERNNSWKLISTVSPPKVNEIPKNKTKTDTQEIVDKNIVLDVSKENQGLEVTTKDLGEDIAQFTELCNELAFRYWHTLTESIEKRRSFVLSPYSITSMLAMMFMGAKGATSGEMNEILKLDDMVTFNPHFTLKNISDSIETTPSSGVIVSAFVRELFSDRSKGKILTFYKERAQHFYNGHVEEVNFKLISDIIRRRTNLLVKRYTWGRIVEYMKSNTITMQPPLAAFSTNVFQTDCSESSVEGRDGEMYFVVSPNVRQRRLVPVPAVVFRTGFLAGYDPALDATAAALGNTNSIISTLFLMPGQQGNIVHAEDLEALEKRLLDSNPTTPSWNRLLRTLLPRMGLELQIPRFSHKSIFNVSTTLKKMGLKDLFDPEHADLGGLNGPSKDLYLSDMVQSTTFVTCGEGVIGEQHHIEEYPEILNGPQRRRTSRWITEWDEPRDYQRAFHDPHDVGDAMSLPLHLRPRQARLPSRNAQPARLKFDRPFLYFVRHNPSGMILYVGRYNPRLLP